MARSRRSPTARSRPRVASGRPQARGLATRRKVLAAAETLFARGGYEPTSMADVAARAGVGVGTLYHHFPDKRALLLALIDDWGDRELARARDDREAERLFGSDPRAAFGAYLRARSEGFRREGGLYLVLLELAERDGDIRMRLNRIDQVGIERVREWLVLGQHRGIIRDQIDPLVAAFLVRQSIRAAAMEVFVHGMTDPTPDRMLAGLIDMIRRYIFVEESD